MHTHTGFDHSHASHSTYTNAPWMPLDELAELWAAFGRQGRTVAAARATSEAFAALAEERSALRAYNHLDGQHRAGPIHYTYQLSSHESTIESLSQAATHWFNVAGALEAHLEYGPVDEEDTASEHDLQALIGHVLEQRERVWSIGLAVLQEQVQAFQAWSGSIEVGSAE